MSISNTRSLLEKSGCGVIVAITLGVVMVVGLMGPSCRPGGDQPNQSTAPTLLKVGKHEITGIELDGAIDTAIRTQEAQMAQMAGPDAIAEGVTGRDRMAIMAATLRRQAEEALVLPIADELGITVDEAAVERVELEKLDRAIQDARAQLIAENKIKANATQAEFEKVFQTAYQQTPTAMRERLIQQVKEGLSRPDQKLNLKIAAASALIVERYGKDFAPNDTELKESFDEFVLKTIRFADKPGSPPAAEQAKKAKEEITKGKMFEDAIDQYSADTAPPDKKLRDVTINIPRRSLNANPMLKPVAGLKPGMISEVLSTPQGVLLVKVQAINRNIPADFTQQEAKYRREYIDQLATGRLIEEREKKRSANLITWNDAGLKALFEAQVLLTESTGTPEQMRKGLENFLTNMKAPTLKDGDIFSQPAFNMARYMVIEQLWRSANKTEKEGLREKFVEALGLVLEESDDAGMRMMLVEQLIEMKSEKVGDELLKASEINTSFGNMGESLHNQINTTLDILKRDQLISAATITKIEESQKRWQTDRTEMLAELAQDKKAREEAEKKMEAERKAAEEQAKKDAAAKPADKPAPSSSDLVAPGGATPAPLPGTGR